MNRDTVSFRLLRSRRRPSMSVDASLAKVLAAWDKPSRPRLRASLAWSLALAKSDDREPRLLDIPGVGAFMLFLRRLRRVLARPRVREHRTTNICSSIFA